jgi:hypothetical protein
MAEPRHPNRFELTGYDGVELTYDTTSIAGQPQLHFRDGERDVSRSGDEIESLEIGIGTLVSAQIEAVPDDHTVTVSVLLPTVNLDDGEAEFETVASETTSRTSIGGPALATGPVESYKPLQLRGTARLVAF